MEYGISAIILFLVVSLGVAVGWIANLVKILRMKGMSGMLVMRVIGIFLVPLGVILGYV